MFTTIYFIAGFGLLFLFGYKLCRLLLPSAEFLEHLSLGFFVGSGIFTFLWFILNWFGIRYSMMSGLILLGSLSLILFFVEKYFIKRRLNKKILFDFSYFEQLNLTEKFLLMVIIFLCVSALVHTIFWPIRYWDSMVLYDFRAKVFAQTGFMLEAISRGYFFGYPLLTSLIHTWTYVLGVGNPLFFYGLSYIFLLINFFTNVKKFKVNRLLSLFLVALVAVSPRLYDHTQWGYTNLPYSIYIILGSIYLYWGIKTKDLGSFILSALFIGLSTWTRTAEPFWLSCLIVGVVSSLFTKKWFWPFIYITTIGLIMFPWRASQSLYGQGSNVVNEIALTSRSVVSNIQLSVIKDTYNFVMANVVCMYSGYFILLIVILGTKLWIRSKNYIFGLLILLDLVLIFIGTLFFVKNTTYWSVIPDSLARMVMFIPVLVIFLSAELLSEIKKR